MASDLGWKSVELQIETLVPGILIAVELKATAFRCCGFSLTAFDWFPSNDLVRAAIFVAGSYSVGLVSSMLCRAVVDSVSERGPRAWLFGLFAHVELEKLIAELRVVDSTRLDADLAWEEKQRKWKKVGRWNAAYRSAIRGTSRRAEVDRRRSQGRFVRNLFLPICLSPAALLSPWWMAVLVTILFVAGAVALYAYAEYVVFAEAYDIAIQQKPDPKDKGEGEGGGN